MDEDTLRFRYCQVPGCDYKEPRFSREGHFIAGYFVCPEHAATPEKTRMYLSAFSSTEDRTKP